MKRWIEPRYEPMKMDSRRWALLCTPAVVALAVAAATGACSSPPAPDPIVKSSVQALSASGGDSLRDGDIVTVTGTRSRSGWNSAERKLSPTAVAQQA